VVLDDISIIPKQTELLDFRTAKVIKNQPLQNRLAHGSQDSQSLSN